MLSCALGPALLHVSRKRANDELTNSTVAIEYGRLPKDFALWYLQSDQIPTAVAIDVTIGSDDKISGASGVIIQAIPEIAAASDSLDQALERNLMHAVKKGLQTTHPAKIASQILGVEVDVLNEIKLENVAWQCDCSHDYYLEKLVMLPAQDRQEIAAEGDCEVICEFCKSKYVFPPNEVLTNRS